MVTTQIIANILQTVLALDDDQVWIYNQKRRIPPDKRMYLVVGVAAMKAFGVNNYPDPSGTGVTEDRSQQMQETLTIDAFGYEPWVMNQIGPVIGALKSTYSQQQQELLGMSIFPVPTTINDVSAVEGTAILYRFSITVNVIRAYTQTSAVPYYSTFPTTTVNAKG